jgi:8-oxo-dGTP diphosphatase
VWKQDSVAENLVRTVDVAIGIVLKEGRVLICRRRKDGGHLAGYWEFPGGKCEPSESPVDTLHRELLEEVGIAVELTHRFPAMEHQYPEVCVRLHAFVCRHTTGDAQPLAADELLWVAPAELPAYRFPEANGPLLEQLAAQLQGDRIRQLGGY